jgi:hypothetical protein
LETSWSQGCAHLVLQNGGLHPHDESWSRHYNGVRLDLLSKLCANLVEVNVVCIKTYACVSLGRVKHMN